MTAAPLLPLQVLLKAMQQKCDARDWDGAAKLARIAAPYLHGRCATVGDISAIDLQQLSDAELDCLIEARDEDDQGGAAK